MRALLPSVFRLVGHYRVAILLLVFVVSVSYFLQGYLSFDNLREHRAILTEFRDANYLVAVVVFILVYTLFVAFSVPGGLVLSLTGGFLFATFPGVFYNMVGATLGASAIFLAARWGFGANLAATLENSEGLVKRIKDGVDENQWSMLFLIRLVPGGAVLFGQSGAKFSRCAPAPLCYFNFPWHFPGGFGVHLHWCGAGRHL
jgi:uncharacterized membrane protein YdjX (TVP38/TMEM64 family)